MYQLLINLCEALLALALYIGCAIVEFTLAHFGEIVALALIIISLLLAVEIIDWIMARK